eukprot:CCRYP_009443-RA/>CCRYP_009443-RA protein AED:0.10 eAED:0.10 QI:76/1/1/1/0.5/0.4/5/2352/1498
MLRSAVQPPLSTKPTSAKSTREKSHQGPQMPTPTFIQQQPQEQHREIRIQPLQRRPLLKRLDVSPFLFAYSILISCDAFLVYCLPSADNGDHGLYHNAMSTTATLIDLLFLLLLCGQLVLFLKCQWDPMWRAYVAFWMYKPFSRKDASYYNSRSSPHGTLSKIQAMKSWTHCLILPQSHLYDGSSTAMRGEEGGIVPVSIVETHVPMGTIHGGSDERSQITSYAAVVHFRGLTYRCCINLFPEWADECVVKRNVHADLLMESTWKMNGRNDNGILEEIDEVDQVETTILDSNGKGCSTTKIAKEKAEKILSAISWEPHFHRLHFPIDLPLNFYLSWSGHSTKHGQDTLETTTQIYNRNITHIPLPSILSLLSQQLLQPLFLFQLFCVILWSLDEYWMYALFTLFSLIMFEWTMAYNRWKGVKRLREEVAGSVDEEEEGDRDHSPSMPRSPLVECFRNGRWMALPSNQLVVGDIVSLVSPTMMQQQIRGQDHEQGNAIPADLLLLSGRAVVNEAMLTGESVPQVKESIRGEISGDKCEKAQLLDLGQGHKRCVLFGGTVLMDHHSEEEEDGLNNSRRSSDEVIPAPSNGLVCFVLRTGFDTIQGSLLRSLAYRAESGGGNAGGGEGVNSKETFLFLALLLLFALVSASTVVQHAWGDVTRNHFKLILHVIIIITSVIPPELPMELSLAVTSSLSELIKRCQVYCTEPFRIPLAGLVDTCCFDKTGTLTSDELRLHGVRLPPPNEVQEESGNSSGLSKTGDEGLILFDDISSKNGSGAALPRETLRVMVGCQSLALSHAFVTGRDGRTTVTSKLVGDPLEKAVMEACSWTILPGAKGVMVEKERPSSSTSAAGSIRVLHRFAFSSTLRRMTVLAIDSESIQSNENRGSNTLWALTKGGPEAILPMLDPKSINSADYRQSYRRQMSLGRRVLALAFRNLGPNTTANIEKWKSSRDKVEQNLVFAGLLVMDSPLKADTSRIIKELRAGQQSTVMITGDAVLTAAEVARRVGIIDAPEKSTYELCYCSTTKNEEKQQGFRFVPLDSFDETKGEKGFEYTPQDINKLSILVKKGKAAICMTGDVLTKMALSAVEQGVHSGTTNIKDDSTALKHPAATKAIASVIPVVSVFARHEPRHKEAVIAAFNSIGRHTLMCGDGSNDIGALKQAHVGVSIISVPDLEGKQRDAYDAIRSKRKTPNKFKDKKSKQSEAKQVESYLQAIAEAEDDLMHVGLGNASVASPFTARKTSIRCCKDILQQGRCTLVTMIQIYKILGVNCLVTALVLTKLHQVGVKQGDRQMTAEGVVVAGLFLFFTRGKPLSKLSPKKPPSSILCITTLISMAAQFGVHFLTIMFVTHMSNAYIDPYDPSMIPDGPFVPNTLNTATFLITVLAMINTFVVNYQGQPFVENLSENKLLFRSIVFCYCVLFTCAMDLFPPLNELLQLSSLPTSQKDSLMFNKQASNSLLCFINQTSEFIGFQLLLVALMIFDTSLVIFFEYLIRRWNR